MDDDRRGEPWRQAYYEFVKEDYTSLDPGEAKRLRSERLRYDLKVHSADDVDEVVRVVKATILEVVRDQSSFSWTTFNALPWREALAQYKKMKARETELSRDWTMREFDHELLSCKRAIGELLRQAARVVVSGARIGELLRKKRITISSETITRFLVSEINAEHECPQIIGIILLHSPHYRPHYAAVSGAEFSAEFLEVCRIFDH